MQKDYSNLDRELNEKLADAQRMASDMNSEFTAASQALEKAEAERDQLRGQLAAITAAVLVKKLDDRQDPTGWLFCKACNSEIAPTDTDDAFRRVYVHRPKCPVLEALATPHTAATPDPYDDLSRLEADRIIDAARTRQAADPVQVRTPGGIGTPEASPRQKLNEVYLTLKAWFRANRQTFGPEISSSVEAASKSVERALEDIDIMEDLADDPKQGV